MIELSEKMFYKVKFNIAYVDKTKDLLWKVVHLIYNWQTNKWNKQNEIVEAEIRNWTKIKDGGRLFSKDNLNTVYIESRNFSLQSKKCWACKIVERPTHQTGVAGRSWTTQIGIEKNPGETAVFSCIVSYNDQIDYLGPCQPTPEPTVPGIVKTILSSPDFICTSGGKAISVEPKRISVGDWYDFLSMLSDKNRLLPIIYISPYVVQDEDGREKVTYAIDPNELANVLCGNAIVMYSDDNSFNEEMRECCKYEYVCLYGQVRVYLAGLNIDDENDSYRHRFLKRSTIENFGQKEIISIFRRVFAQDLHYYEDKDYISIKYCEKLNREYDRQQRIQRIKEEHKNEFEKFGKEFWEDFDKLEEKLSETEESRSALDEENKNLKSERYNLLGQIESTKAILSKASKMESSLLARNQISSIPKCASEIIKYFSIIFEDRIAFSEDAIKTSKECKLKPDDLWNVFFHLATTMYDLQNSNCTNPYDEFTRKTGISCARGEGAQTRKDAGLMRQFVTEYEGEEIDIEPHITFPKAGQSIHFGKSGHDGRIVVGSCGPHKEIFSSRKAK